MARFDRAVLENRPQALTNPLATRNVDCSRFQPVTASRNAKRTMAVTLSGKANATSALGASLYFWARLVYVPVYAAGVPVVRTLVWGVSIAGLIMVLGALA